MKLRIQKAQKRLARADLDLYLVSHLPHVRYLCGYSGSNGLLLLSRKNAEFYTDSRYSEQIKKEVRGARKIVPSGGQLIAALSESRLLKSGHPRLGIQARHLNLEAHTRLSESLNGALLVPHDGLIEPLATIKDSTELGFIEKATRIADSAFAEILEIMRPGMREREVAAELEYIMLALGSEGTAFDTICASGHRSALPHGVASSKKLASGDFVTLDFGALVKGYCSDITRTVVLGKASARQKRVYDIVRRAQAAGVRRVLPGKSTQAVDRACRQIIKKAGFGPKFGHGTGHGIGLEVHQAPSLSPRTDGILKSGMVVTVEPGIYISGFGGVRIEDDVLVTRNGNRVLTGSPRRLIEL